MSISTVGLSSAPFFLSSSSRATSNRQPSEASPSAPQDLVQLSGGSSACSVDLSTEPTRRPLDATGLQKSLDEFHSFSQKEYFNESSDLKAKEAYYKNIDWSAGGAEVFDELSKTLAKSHTTKLNYRPAQHLYPWVDLHPDGKLHSIYSNQPMDGVRAITEDWEIGQLDTQAENAMVFASPLSPEAAAAAFTLQQAAAFNCEHVVPQSWFSKAQPERGDLHHLFACDPSCNSRRGNLPYDELKGSAGSDWNDSQCGTISSGHTFEPANGKGAVARATLYFLMRYPKVIGRYDKADVERLVDWSRRYPPDLYEKHRNQAIFEVQGNRNPLIDYPEKIGAIDFTQGLR